MSVFLQKRKKKKILLKILTHPPGRPTPIKTVVKLVAGINVTATVGTFLLICVKLLMHSINNNYLSQEVSLNPEPQSPQAASVKAEKCW